MKNWHGKRALAFVLALVMCVSLYTPAIAAPAGTAEVSVGTGTVNAGESVVVPVIIADNPGFTNFAFTVTCPEGITITAYTGKYNSEYGICYGAINGNPLTGIFNLATADPNFENGKMFFLTYKVDSGVAPGNYPINIKLKPDGGVLENNQVAVPVNFHSGTITVNAAPSTDCTVKFIDGATTITKTVAKGSVMTDLPAEPVKANHIFAGWYSGTVTGATDYIVTGNSFTGTEFRPKYDTVAASADYHAVWIGEASTAALVKTGNNAVIKESYALIQTAINGSTVATTVKMLTDCTQTLTIPAGKTITLDMNGHSITLSVAEVHGINVTGGTLSVENSSAKVAAFTTKGNGIEVSKNGRIPLLRDIQFKSGAIGVRLWPGTADLIENCDISGSSFGLELIADFGGNSPIPSTVSNIVNTKLTGERPIEANPGTSVHVTTASMKSTRAFNTVNLSRVTLPAGKTWGAANTEGYHSVVDGFTIFLFEENKESFVEGIYVPTGTTPASAVTPPEKPGSDTVNYVFDGWADANGAKPTISAITANTTLYATYRAEAKAMVAQVGDKKYLTVNAALDAITAVAGKTGTIKLLADVTWESVPNCMTVPADANITLDFAGHKINANANTLTDVGQITNNGTLKLTSTGGTRGTIEALHDSDTVIYNTATGKLSVQNLNILGEQYSIRNSGGTVDEISGCKLAPDANYYGVAAGLRNDHGTVTLIADTESTRRICNGDGNGTVPTKVTTLRNVTIGTPTVLTDVGIENANNAVITSIENCTVYAATMAIYNRGTGSEPGTIGNVTGGRYYSKCDTAIAKPDTAPDVVYAAVVNYGNGDLTLSGGAYKGGLNAQPSKWNVPKKDIKFATDMRLSTTPDADGYYSVVSSGTTLTFNNGTTTETIKVTGDKMTQLPAEPTKQGHIFAGWYSGTVTGADATTYIVAGDSFTGTEFRPKYDTVTASANYRALWLPTMNTAAYVKVGNVARIWETYAAIQTAINSATAATTVKMLTDCTEKLTIPKGKTITLDMNGHSITPNFTVFAGDGGMSAIKNSGTLSLENSSSAVALIAPTAGTKPDDWFINYSDGIFVDATGVITAMRDITITTANYDITGGQGTVRLIDNCALTTTINAEACIFNVIVGELRNSTLTGTKSATITTGGMSVTLGEGNTFKPAAGSPAITVDGSNTVVFPAGKTMGAADVSGNYTLTTGFTVYYLNEAKTAALETDYCPTGTVPAFSGTNPTKTGLGMTSYRFDGWADSIGTLQTVGSLTANTELHAKFTPVTPTEVASVGANKYPTLQAAADAIVATGSKTGTITVLQDFTFIAPKYDANKPGTNENILNVPKGADITLDLGGHTITMEKPGWYFDDIKPVFVNQGKLLLKNGIITMPGKFSQDGVYGGTMLLNEERGDVTLNGITATGFEWGIKNIGSIITDIVNTTLTAKTNAILSTVKQEYFNANVDFTDIPGDVRASKILKITSGTFANMENTLPAMSCAVTHVGEIAGGTFTGKRGAQFQTCVIDKISGGQFKGTTMAGMELNPQSTVGTITGGTFEGANGLYVTTFGNNGNVVRPSTVGSITGGTFTGTNNGLYLEGFVTMVAATGQPVGTLVPSSIGTISGGTFKGTAYNGIYMDIGGHIETISSGTVGGATFGVQANTAADGNPAAKGVTAITGGKFSGSTASVSPVGSSGACTVSGGSYKGKLVGVTFATDMRLSTTPDADGYYRVEAAITTPPIISGDKEVAAVPDKPLDSGKTMLDATSTNNVKKTEIDLPASVVGSMDQSDGLSIKANAATVAFDRAALGDIKTNAAAGAVKLAIAEQTIAELPEAQKLAAKDATKVLDLKLTKGAGAESVTFGKGTATIVVDYVQQDAALTVNVYHIADDGTKTKRECKLVGNKLSFTTSSFSTYIVAEDLGQKAEYTMTVKTTAQNYNPGDIITANIVATAPVTTGFGSCQFTMGYDTATLELQTLTSTLAPAATINGGTLVFASTDAAISVGTGDTVIGTATFKVKPGTATGTSVINLLKSEMTYKGKDVNPTAAAVVPQTVNLHNLTVTFAAGANSTMVSATAYAKYNTAGLWTTEAYTTPFVFPVPTAKTDYRLATKLWGDGTNVYTEVEAKALTLTANKTLTVQTVKTATITFAAAAGGSIAAKDPVTVDAGTKISTITLPVATANPGYSFTGWNDGTNTIDTAIYAVDKTITLTAQFAPVNYAWIAPITTNTVFAVTSGVSVGNEVTHGTPIVFTATANAGYVITGVTYSVGGGTATALTPAGDTYTIPGAAILGTIKVEIATQKYHTVTFKGTTGAALVDQVAYVKDSAAGLYTDKTFKTVFTVPKLIADAGYRLAADTAAEPLWKDAANTGYTSVSIKEALLTADAVLTAQTVKTWTLSFVAGANGSLTYTETALASKTVDSGYVIKATDIPATVGSAGYVFDAWSTAPLDAAVTADITYTASFKDGTYAINFSTTGATFTPTAGVATGQVTHGTNVTFTMTEADGYKVTAVKAQIGSAPAETLTAASGVYTILGSKITGDVSVTVESNLTYVVTFAPGTNGTLTGSASKTVDKDYVLVAADIPTPTANSGYVFKEWQVNNIPQAPLGHKVIAAITFTAVFTEGSYAVTMPDAAAATVNATSGLTGGKATYNTPVVFTVTGGTGKIVNKVYYTVAGGAKTELTTTDGTYTIPGSVITAGVTISVDTLDGTITFVNATAYKAMETGKQMLVFTTAQLTSNKYTLTDGAELYWSSKYGAYVRFVADTETVNTLSAKLTTAAGTATEILYDGNLNNVGEVTAADAGIINDILHNKRLDPTTDMHRFKADVNGDRVVTTADFAIVTNTAAGIK